MGDPSAEVVDGSGEVHGARCGGGGSRQGTGPLSAQSTLMVPGSQWKDRICRRTRSGSCVPADQAAVQRGGRDSGDDRPVCADDFVAGESYSDGPAMVQFDPGDLGVTADVPAAGLQPGGERGGQVPGAALGDGEPDVLGEHRQQPPEQAGSRGVRWDVGMRGVPGDQ